MKSTKIHDFVIANHDRIRELDDNLWRQCHNRGEYSGQQVTVYDDPMYFYEFATLKLYLECKVSCLHDGEREHYEAPYDVCMKCGEILPQ